MRIAALQFDIAWQQREQNYRSVERWMELAGEGGADLLVLPEMFATGFSLEPQITVEKSSGQTAEFLSHLARKHKIAVLGGLVLPAVRGLGLNSALVFDKNGDLVSSYAKTHLFSFMEEEKAHVAGDGPRPFEICGVKCACFICYDLRFPEMFRSVADGVECIFVIASWPAARQRHWDVLLPARAVENQLYLVGVNRVGAGGGLSFTGGSAIYHPGGNCLSHGGETETLLWSEIDPSEVHRIRAEMPFLADKRYTTVLPVTQES